MPEKTVVCLSGGIDSTVLLARALYEDRVCYALSFEYGQRHAERELEAARAITKFYGIAHQILELSKTVFHGPSALLVDATHDIPNGHYTDQVQRATVCPARNMVLLSCAAAYAINLQCTSIAYAAHSGDHAIYPDCRPAFVLAMADTLLRCHYDPITLWTPWLFKYKDEIVTIGDSLHAPFELTYSCYRGGVKHCGRCGTCVERKEAFQLAKVPDPTEYEA